MSERHERVMLLVLRVRVDDSVDAPPVIVLQRHDLAAGPPLSEDRSEGTGTTTHRPSEALETVRTWLDEFCSVR